MYHMTYRIMNMRNMDIIEFNSQFLEATCVRHHLMELSSPLNVIEMLQAVVITYITPRTNDKTSGHYLIYWVFVHKPFICRLHLIVVAVQFSSRVKLCCTCGLSSNKV